MDDYSFQVMREYPDDRYLDILEDYAKHQLWRDLRAYETTQRDRAGNFYKTLAVYKNDRAASIFRLVFKYQPYSPCNYEPDEQCYGLYEAICDNSCEAFKNLVQLVEPFVMDDRLRNSSQEYQPVDTIESSSHEVKEKETVWWFQ
jgi:hypothetical protein